MKFSKIVARARIAAKNWNWVCVVYQDLNSRWWNKISKYHYLNKIDFDRAFETGKYAWIKLLIIYPSGAIVQ